MNSYIYKPSVTRWSDVWLLNVVSTHTIINIFFLVSAVFRYKQLKRDRKCRTQREGVTCSNGPQLRRNTGLSFVVRTLPVEPPGLHEVQRIDRLSQDSLCTSSLLGTNSNRCTLCVYKWEQPACNYWASAARPFTPTQVFSLILADSCSARVEVG